MFKRQSIHVRKMSNLRWAGGALALGLAIFGCASELDKSQDYDWGYADSQGGSSNNPQGGSGNNPQGGSGNNPQGGSTSNGQGGAKSVPPDPTCLTSILNSQCKGCHSPNIDVSLSKGLDLAGANVGQRLLNKASTCGDGPLIDPSNKTSSTILKRVSGEKTGCNGQAMPSGNGLTGADLQCFKDWINGF